jgi:hypothetical protein
LPGAQQQIFRYIHLDDVKVSLRQSPGSDLLSKADCKTLDDIIRSHGQKPTWALVRETHKLPEYVETYVGGTSTVISYDSIARHSGNSARFRKNRPVISPESAAQMLCPFPSGAGI